MLIQQPGADMQAPMLGSPGIQAKASLTALPSHAPVEEDAVQGTQTLLGSLTPHLSAQPELPLSGRL